MVKSIAEAIMDRGFPLITDYVSFDKLQQLLISAPSPTWGFPPYQYHFPTSPSGYYGCPSKVEKGKPSFVMVRGTQFHEHYGPIIVKAFGLTEGQYSLEPMAVMALPCRHCLADGDKHNGKDSCGEGEFPFGGSLDFPIWINEWLVDFKFSMQSPDKMDAYVWQMAAYAAMINKGFIRQEPHGKKAEWKWNTSNYRIKHISILHIHPDSFKCTEIRVPIIPFEKIWPLVYEHHLAKAHGKISYRPNKYCKNCENLLKPRLVLQQEKRGAPHEMRLEPNKNGEMVPNVELSCTQMGRIYDPKKDESFEIKIYDSQGEGNIANFKEHIAIKEKKEVIPKSPKPPKLYESKRRVRCKNKECSELVNKYYKLDKKNYCEKCALELGLLPPIEEKKSLNIDFGDDGISDLIGEEESMNINCQSCGKSFTPVKNVLRCDDCLHPKIEITTDIIVDSKVIKDGEIPADILCGSFDNGICSGSGVVCGFPWNPNECKHSNSKKSKKQKENELFEKMEKNSKEKMLAENCYYYKNGGCEGDIIHRDGMIEACNYPMDPKNCEQYTIKGSPKARAVIGQEEIMVAAKQSHSSVLPAMNCGSIDSVMNCKHSKRLCVYLQNPEQCPYNVGNTGEDFVKYQNQTFSDKKQNGPSIFDKIE